MHVQSAATDGKPDPVFPATTNNNNLLYANRNTYGHQTPTTARARGDPEGARNAAEHNCFTNHLSEVVAATVVVVDPSEPLKSFAQYVAASGKLLQSPDQVGKLEPALPTPGCPSSPNERLAEQDQSISPGGLVLPNESVARTTVAQPETIPVGLVKHEGKFKNHRRPINDFLMFCKRHRPIVSRHFVSKENRFITKKLGLWWSQLSKEDKKPYKALADKYKAKYLEAFPNYRWGKQQQCPPSNQQDYGEMYRPDQASILESQSLWATDVAAPDYNGRDTSIDGGCMEVAQSLMEMAAGKGLPVATFKLADETQMGSLSTLIAAENGNQQPTGAIKTDNGMKTSEHNYSVTHNNSSTMAMECDSCPLMLGNSREEPYANMRQHFLEQSRPKNHQQQQQSATVTSSNKYALSSSSSVSFGGQQTAAAAAAELVRSESTSVRASRSCKGKRYQEFMIQQQLARHTNGGASSSSSARKAQHKRPAPMPTMPSEPATMAMMEHHHINGTATIQLSSGGAGPVNSTEPLLGGLPCAGDKKPEDLASAEAKKEKLNQELSLQIEELPCFELEDFLAKQKHEKKRKKSYAVSSKAYKKRSPPKSSSSSGNIPTPANNSNTNNNQSIPCVPPPTRVASSSSLPHSPPPPPSAAAAAAAAWPSTVTEVLPSAMAPSVVVVTAPLPVPPVPTATATAPTKVVGSAKRKAPKKNITRQPVH